MDPPKPGEKLHWLWELDDFPGEHLEYCKRHNYWYYPSKGCYMCQEEGVEPIQDLKRL